MSNGPTLLCLVDNPTKTGKSGFSRVSSNLISRWLPHFEAIDVWGINYWDTPDDKAAAKKLGIREIYSSHNLAGGPRVPWFASEGMRRFLNLILNNKYTHLWMLQDTFNLTISGQNFPKMLKQVCDATQLDIVEMGVKKTIHKPRTQTTLYFPVDAPLEPAWCEIIDVVDNAVAYTEYGKHEVLRNLGATTKDIKVIPHGVDASHFFPLGNRIDLRRKVSKMWDMPIADDDFLLLNVNSNQRRKDTLRSLEVLKVLINDGIPAKLIMHMHHKDDIELMNGTGIDLEVIGNQLGLKLGRDWVHSASFCHANAQQLEDAELNELYNAVDVTFSTTLGEGWGLSFVEATSAGCIVAAPRHTACTEVLKNIEKLNGEYGYGRQVLFDIETHGSVTIADNSRVRHRVNVNHAVATLTNIYKTERHLKVRQPMTDKLRNWLSWDRIANEWLTLFKV